MHQTIDDFVASGLERGWLSSVPTTIGELMHAYKQRERALVALAVRTGSGKAMRHLALHRGHRHVERKVKALPRLTNYFSYRHTRRRAEDLKAEIAAARLRWDRSRPHLDLDDDVVLDLSQWSSQRSKLDNADRWPSDFEPPPNSSLLDTAALIAAPRPGPSVRMLTAA